MFIVEPTNIEQVGSDTIVHEDWLRMTCDGRGPAKARRHMERDTTQLSATAVRSIQTMRKYGMPYAYHPGRP